MSNKIRISKEQRADSVGRIFIIPNKSATLDEFINGGEDIKNTYVDINPEEDKFVQVWLSEQPIVDENGMPENFGRELMNSGKESTFSENERPEIKDFQFNGLRKGVIFQYLPASYFKDKKEGDFIYIDILDNDGKEVIYQYCFELKQAYSRYSAHGSFEEVLQKVI